MSTLEFNNAVIGFRQALQYFALSLTKDEEDAHDLLQDTMLKAIKYRDKFVEKTNLKAWLYTIMKNTFINNYRRKVKANTIIDQTADLYYINVADANHSPSPASTYQHQEVKKQVAALADEYRIPFNMHFQGFKYKEIADELNLPIGTVKSRIFLARQKLMDNLKDYR
jgi:RNA polymerase sigma factor (sigma-70 family)